jgi:hypothetical protein
LIAPGSTPHDQNHIPHSFRRRLCIDAKGAGHEGIVASAHKAPKIADLTGPYAATSAIVRRQAAPRISLRTRLVLKTIRIISTPLSKSP